MQLGNTKIKRWKYLVNAFVKQYKFNIDIASNKMSLQDMEMGDRESIWEYA
jgi:hypothetical protein